jgi:trehalose utilization protein
VTRRSLNLYIGSVICISMLAGISLSADAHPKSPNPIRVVIWDEQQPAQKTVYSNFLGNEIAEYLRKACGDSLTIKSVRLDDPDQGLAAEALDNCDVLLWWGHVRHGDVKDELAKDIARRVKEGKLNLLAIHSAHWSKPFIEVMNERSIMDALSSLPKSERAKATVVTIPGDRRLMDPKERLTPYWEKKAGSGGNVLLEVKLPSCVFPAVSADGKPGHLTTLLPKHPIAKGLPGKFDIPQTEMYGGPFHVPTPDALIFDEKWDSGQNFPSGCAWKVGKGRVFYFRPGHETFPVFKQAEPLKVIENAVFWLASRK